MVWNFLLYLLYGLAFFTLGVAILSRETRLSELGIAKVLWLLALFGIIHGFHEWLDLLEQLNPDINTTGFYIFRLIVVSTSFLFLLYFGLFLNIITLYGDQALKSTPQIIKVLVALSALGLIFIAIALDFENGNDIKIRLLVAFPGGLLSGIGLIMYSRTVRSFSTEVAGNFILAGSFMIAYSVLTGIIPSDVVIPVLDIKVILLRGGSAFLIMFFTIRALSVFSLEQRKLINEKLLRFSQSEKLASMGIMAAGIAHEINNPLTNVSLNIEMLKDIVGGDEKASKKLDAIDRNIQRASSIAKELLHFSRETESPLEPTDISKVLKSSISLLSNQENSSIISLNLQKTPYINGVPWKLEEVFINLLMNSLDACDNQDRIEVVVYHDADIVTVSIRDTGHGIPDTMLHQVFDPFFTTKEVGKGTGLGLSMCYNIIKQHGGEISLESPEQVGTTVTINLPVASDDT
jgi:two-component system NtrC family sensor kinase